MANTRASYSLEELHKEIAKDDDWRTKIRYVPRAKKANLRFHLIERSKGNNSQEKNLLIGTHKTVGRERVYAQVYSFANSKFNMVDLNLHNGTVIRLYSSSDPKEADLLRRIDYVHPFVCLKNVGSGTWRNSLRSLFLYYFLEQGIPGFDRFIPTTQGMEGLKKACTSIATDSIRMQRKPVRASLALPKTAPEITTAQAQSNTKQNDEAEKRSVMKLELLPAVPVEAPENKSTRAVSVMVQQDDTIAAQLLPKILTGHQELEPEPKPEPVLAAHLPANEPKRKRFAPDHTIREGEYEKEEDPELVCSRFKRLVRLKIESLEREEIATQDQLKAQSMSLDEAQMSVSRFEKALLIEKASLEAVQVAKAATEARLEEVRREVTKNKAIQKGFDSFRA